MNIHLKIVGYLYVVLGIIGFLSFFVLLYMMYGSGTYALGYEEQMILQNYSIGYVLVGLLLVASVLSVVTGLGILKAAKWAKTLGMIIAALGILDFPFGTLLGAYTLWVLTKKNGSI